MYNTRQPERRTLMKSKPVITTERLTLHEMEQSDFPALCTMLQDPEVMYAWERCFPDEEVRAWIDRNGKRYQEHGCGYWLAVSRDSGEVVGQIGLIPEEIEGHSHSGVGWLLARKHWHNGYAAEGAKACLDHAFSDRKTGRVIADIRPMNTNSIRVAERIGMIAAGEYDKLVGGVIMPHRLYYARTPEVEVNDYDPVWLKRFEQLRTHLSPVLETFGGRLEHVGSTSVAGLAAKPVIDADYLLPDAALWPQVKAVLEPLGFFHRGNGDLPGREMFTESLQLEFRHNFYVCMPDCIHASNHLRLRDFLRGNAEAARQYGALKKRLAAQYPNDVDRYCAGKSDLISAFLSQTGMSADVVAMINGINKTLPQRPCRNIPEKES